MTIEEQAGDSTGNRFELWSVLGESVRGYSHIREGAPNQDAIRWNPPNDGTPNPGPPYVLAVADGHGDEKCRFSDVGSQLAVEVAREKIGELLSLLDSGDMTYAEVNATAKERLASSVVHTWRGKVLEHAEAQLASPQQDLASSDAPPSDPAKMYGTTLLAAGVSPNGIVFMQVGDGAIYTVGPRGEVSKPLRDDPSTFANETTSLCSSRADEIFRVRMSPFEGTVPVAILLATDGFVNAYPEKTLPQICREYVEELHRPGGIKAVREYLEEVLSEASQRGSGDDTTLGILFRHDSDYQYAAPSDQEGVGEGTIKRDLGHQEAAEAPKDTTEAVAAPPQPPQPSAPVDAAEPVIIPPETPSRDESRSDVGGGLSTAYDEAIGDAYRHQTPKKWPFYG